MSTRFLNVDLELRAAFPLGPPCAAPVSGGAARLYSGQGVDGHPAGMPALSQGLRSEATTPLERRREYPSFQSIPEGCQPRLGSIEIPVFKPHSRRREKLRHFRTKRLHPMVRGLICNVSPHAFPCRRADGEGSVTHLPGESRQPHFVMHPHRGGFFQLAHEIGQAMRGFESHQKVDMVRHASHTLGNAAQAVDRSTQIFVEPSTPGFGDPGMPVFGRENYMVVQREEGRGHDAGVLASLRDASGLQTRCIVTRGVASLNNGLRAEMPAASWRNSALSAASSAIRATSSLGSFKWRAKFPNGRDFSDNRLPHPAGMPALSQGSSEATPLETGDGASPPAAHPAGIPALSQGLSVATPLETGGAAPPSQRIPEGCQPCIERTTISTPPSPF